MDIFDNFKQAVGSFMSKKGKDVNLPNERPVSASDPRWADHRQRLAEDTSNRFKKVAANAMEQELLRKNRKQ